MTRRFPSWTRPVFAVGASGLIFLYYWTLISDGKFFATYQRGQDLVFNSMIDHMLRGEFDVDPAIITTEGFTKDGRTYAYFGVVPALLRLPFAALPRFMALDFTAIYCAIAATIAAVANIVAVLRVGRLVQDASHRRRVVVFAAILAVFGGAQVQYLRPSMYQESVYWAVAIAAVFVAMAFAWCADVAGRRSWHLVTMAVLAGVCLLTRVSTGIGLYAACTGMIIVQASVAQAREAGFSRRAAAACRAVAAPLLVLVLFALVCGGINYARWGNPATFQDYRYYGMLTSTDPAHDIVENYGFFNIRRVLFGISYYFFPIWAIIRPDGHFLFRELQDRLYFLVEGPPATFLLTDPLLCVLACMGLAGLARRGLGGTDRMTALIVAAGLAMPGVLMFMAIAASFRYRMEFYPLLEFLALFGLWSLAQKLKNAPRLLTGVFCVLLVFSVVSAHVFMIEYKIVAWGDTAYVEKIGWIAAHKEYLMAKFPSIADHLFR